MSPLGTAIWPSKESQGNSWKLNALLVHHKHGLISLMILRALTRESTLFVIDFKIRYRDVLIFFRVLVVNLLSIC